MKKILWVAIGGMFFTSAQAQMLKCEVSYKAKKDKTDSYLFRDINNPMYDAGKVTGKGKSLNQCKKNALKPLTRDGWKITYSSSPRKI
ncbi:MAG: hypothetical protein ACPGSM_19860 [Thiolinea sp.]